MRWIYAIAAFLFIGTQVTAQETEAYVGHWKLSSSGGYSGNLALDGIGGCSYFITSAFLSIQATCVIRVLDDGTLMIFGSQEGSATTSPAYGDQLTIPRQTTVQQTIVNMIITQHDTLSMSGQLFAGGQTEKVTFQR